MKLKIVTHKLKLTLTFHCIKHVTFKYSTQDLWQSNVQLGQISTLKGNVVLIKLTNCLVAKHETENRNAVCLHCHS